MCRRKGIAIMPGTENSRLMAQADMTRALENEAKIARLQEASEHGKQDRRDIWETISALRGIGGQIGVVISKMDDLKEGQEKLTAKVEENEHKLGDRLTALEKRDERGKGAMAMLLAIAGGFGGVLTMTLQWAAIHFWPTNTK